MSGGGVGSDDQERVVSGLTWRALIGLVAAMAALLLAVVRSASGALWLAAPAGLGALGLAIAWAKQGRERFFYGACLLGALVLLVPLQQPLDPADRGLALAGVVGLLVFLEYGHLRHRIEQLDLGEVGHLVPAALRRRLTRVLAWTTLATAAILILTAIPGPWFSSTFAQSLERGGPVGVLLVGGAVALLTATVARLRVLWAERGADVGDDEGATGAGDADAAGS